jgi:hypothetical protein
MSATATTADRTAAAILLGHQDDIDARTAMAVLSGYRMMSSDITALATVQRALATVADPNAVELTKLVNLIDRFVGSAPSRRKRMYVHLTVQLGRVVHFSVN